MSEYFIKTPHVTDAVKAALADQGIIPKLKQSVYPGETTKDTELQSLKAKAQSAVEEIEKLIGGANLDQATATKLISVLVRLQGALHGGKITRESIAGLLAEATSLISISGNATNVSEQTRKDELWQTIEGYNKDIDDDFEKMRNHGVKFSDKLWNRHKELMRHMHDLPHDIAKQKELDAVDDALLLQAEPQIGNHPEAKPIFDDAKKKSKERHEAVDKHLAKTDHSLLASAFENDQPATEKITMDDVTLQRVGHKNKSTDKHI